MTFLKRYSFGAVGFNFLIAAFGLQWALLMQGWFHSLDYTDGKIKIGVERYSNCSDGLILFDLTGSLLIPLLDETVQLAMKCMAQ